MSTKIYKSLPFLAPCQLLIQLTLALIALPAAECHAEACFREHALAMQEAINVRDVAAGDLDGDGDVDLAAAIQITNSGSYRMSWFENVGVDAPLFVERVFWFYINHDFTPWSVEVADLNNDGWVDILVGGTPGSASLLVHSGGPGGVGSGGQFVVSTIGSIREIDVLDFDGDGWLDLLVGSGRWLKNPANGGFGFLAQEDFGVASGESTAAADLDNDGDLDVVLATTNGVRVHRNDGGDPLVFTEAYVYEEIPAPGRSYGVEFADVNGDGILDLVSAASGGIAWFERTAEDFLFTPHVQLEQFLDPRGLSVADLDGDGDVDLVTAHDNATAVRWYENTGATSDRFERREIFQNPRCNGRNVAVFDIDQDGDLDVLNAADCGVSGTSLYWHEQLEAINTRTGERFGSLASAIDAAAPDDEIVADPLMFGDACAPSDLDLATTPVTLRSTGSASTAAGTHYTLGAGSRLRTGLSSSDELLVRGDVHVEASDSVVLAGGNATLAGDVTFASGASLAGGVELVVAGEPRLIDMPIETADGRVIAIDAGNIDGDEITDFLFLSDMHPQNQLKWYAGALGAPSEQEGRLIPQDDLQIDPFSAVLEDVDGDGRDDVLAWKFEGRAWWWWNNGADPPEFVYQQQLGMTLVRGDLLLTDLNNDGACDLVIPGDGLDVYEGSVEEDESFIFTGQIVPGVRERSNCVAAGDFNGDGLVDLVTGNRLLGGGNVLRWHRRLAGEGYAFESYMLDVLTAAEVYTQDLDGDGDIDIVARKATGSLDDGIFWYENLGGEHTQFVRHTLVLGVPFAGRAAVADVDEDGDPDIVYGPGTESDLHWLENNGASPPVFVSRPLPAPFSRGSLSSLQLFDVDGNGFLDVVATGFGITRLILNEQVGNVGVPAGSSIQSFSQLSVRNRSVELAEGASLDASGTMSFDPNSSLSGAGVLAAERVDFAGRLAVRPEESPMIDADYRQFIDDPAIGVRHGVLDVLIDPDGAPSTLAVQGTAHLSGTLVVAIDSDETPEVGAAFELVTATGGFSGTRFDAAILPGLGGNAFFRLEYVEGDPARGVAGAVLLVVDSLSGDGLAVNPQDPTALDGIPNGAALGDVARLEDGVPVAGSDGLPDLAIVLPDATNPSGAPGQLVILVNAGPSEGGGWGGFSGGTISLPTSPGGSPGGESPISVGIGDFDNDKDIDLVVANLGGQTLAPVIASDGGDFVTAALIPVVGRPSDVIVGDLDDDGRADVVVVGAVEQPMNAGVLSAYLANGAPSVFESPLVEEFGSSITTAGIGDFDNDKDIDFALVDGGSSQVIVLRNLGVAQTWSGFEVSQTFAVGLGASSVVVGDLNGDTRPDIVVANRNAGTLSVALNSEAMLFSSAAVPAGPSPRDVTAADLDDDGDLDLALIVNDPERPGERLVRLLRNDTQPGTVLLAQASDIESELRPRFILSSAVVLGGVTRDLDGDGDDDAITVNENPPSARGDARGSIEVFLQGAASCDEDLDSDGEVSHLDLAAVLAAWGTGGAGDITADGTVDMADLERVLAAWGRCP